MPNMPGPRGILFDRPHVVKDALALLEAKGVRDRVTIEPGDFFRSVPAGADAYILSHIIHDWNEDQCLTILGHVRKAMPAARRHAASGQNARYVDACINGGEKNVQKPSMGFFSPRPDSALRVWYRPIQQRASWRPW